jgi:hypothetical protein
MIGIWILVGVVVVVTPIIFIGALGAVEQVKRERRARQLAERIHANRRARTALPEDES